MSRYVFVRLLLGRLWTYGCQTGQGGPDGARKTPCKIEILKFQMVAMETRKFSHGPGIGRIVLNFFMMELP